MAYEGRLNLRIQLNLYIISRILGRHYQETRSHPRSWTVFATFEVEYNPVGRSLSNNAIKAKIIKQIGGGGLR